MDFREREIGFQEADRRYDELVRQRDAGSISGEEFDAQRQQLMVRDDEGRSWTKFGEPGEWHYYDGGSWVRGIPPGDQKAVSEPDGSAAQTQSSTRPEGAGESENGRQRMPLWIPVAGLGGIALLGIVLIVWVLVPYLWSGLASSEQGGPAPEGAALDAAFIHRATPENILANSTFLDNPLINDDPNVILYVTQNWNPGSAAGTYNDHPVGVWYDTSQQRWAIFNQDREAMPDGAAFNVAVLQEPTGAS